MNKRDQRLVWDSRPAGSAQWMMHEPRKRRGITGAIKCFLGNHDYCLCGICMSDDMGRSICLREEPTTSWLRGTKNYHSKLYVRPQHLEEKLAREGRYTS